MKNLDLATLGVEEMNENQLQGVDGGGVGVGNDRHGGIKCPLSKEENKGLDLLFWITLIG